MTTRPLLDLALIAIVLIGIGWLASLFLTGPFLMFVYVILFIVGIGAAVDRLRIR